MSNRTTYGLADTTEYAAWGAMKDRCSNKNNPSYNNYGGRGISFCDRWNKFKEFFSDMGNKPSSEHSLDRIDNNGNYDPENCRWATRNEQGRNKRSIIFLEYHGVVLPQWQWSILSGIERRALDSRIRMGWGMYEALNTPVGVRRATYKWKRDDT